MDTIWRGLDGIRPRLSWDGGKANMAKDPTSPEARPGAAKMFFVGKNDGKMLRKCWENGFINGFIKWWNDGGKHPLVMTNSYWKWPI
jgi:hypothetical protein